MEDSRPEAHDASGPAQAEPVPNGSEHPTPPQALPPMQPPEAAVPPQPVAAAMAPAGPRAASPRYHQHPPPYLQQQQPGPYYQVPPPPPRVLPPNPRWHRPESIPMQAVVIMAVAVALFGSWAAFPGDGVGIGLALTGIAMVAVPLAAGSREDLVPRLPGAVLVAALWSVAAIRDAGWVVFLCSFAAFALTPLALAPQRRFSGTAVTLFMGWLEGLAESFRWARRSRRDKDGRSPSTVRNMWVALVTAGLLVVFGGLFAAADSTFADLIAGLLPEVSPFEFVGRLFLAAFLFPLVLLWIYTAVAKPVFDSHRQGEHRVVSRFELAVPLGALNLLFAAFIAVQLRVFLGGEDYVMETAGLTFADYARRGFWQLSFVAALSLAVIAVAAWLAPKREQADRWTARILLGSLCILSMVVIASALFRMYTYSEKFGLTRMRVWIFTVEIWLAVLFALVVVCCWKLRASWLPRAVLASGALALLGLAAANPDALIARYNIDHDHKLDLAYLRGLSDDAVPEFAALSEEDRECVLNTSWSEFDDEQELLAWNLGYERSKELNGRDDDDDRSTACEDWTYDYQSEPAANGFFHWDTCAMYDLGGVDELFGISASGDYGVVPDDSAQYAQELDPTQGAERVLQCGYYGPGTAYLTIEAFEWPSVSAAVDGVEAMQVEQESGGLYTVTDLDGETTAGYTAWLESDSSAYEYAVAIDELVVVVSLSDTPVGEGAETVGQDLSDQTYELYLSLA